MKRLYSFDKGLIVLLIVLMVTLQLKFPDTIEYPNYIENYRDSVMQFDSTRIWLAPLLQAESMTRTMQTPSLDEGWPDGNILIDSTPLLPDLINGGHEGDLLIEPLDTLAASVNFWTYSLTGRLGVYYMGGRSRQSAGGLYATEWCTFSEAVDIRFSHFRDIQMIQSDFGPTKFYDVTCYEDAYFETDNFARAFVIDDSHFDGELHFNYCGFDEVQINNTKIKGKLVFENCGFDGPISFNENDSIASIEFINCDLPEIISFRGEQEMSFVPENEIGSIYFSPSNTVDSAAVLCSLDFPESYATKLNTTGIDYIRYRLWFPENTGYENRSVYYLNLLKGFKDAGYTDSYENLDKEYQRLQYLHNDLGFVDLFNKMWWDYGYNKLKVIGNSLMLWALFCLINIFLFEKLNREVYPVKFKPLLPPEITSLKRSSWYMRIALWIEVLLNRLGNSVIYTSALFFGLKLELDRFKSNSSLKLYVLLMYCLGLFCVAYIVNIIIVR